MLNIIKPLEISSSIMSLIQDAEEELIIVSPYVNIAGWKKMKKTLSDAVSRNVNIKYYVRSGTTCDLEPLKDIGIKPLLVDDLHTKLYISEKQAIITSQNMTQSSDDYSIDFGHEINDLSEVQQLKEYVNKYISVKIKERKIEFNEVWGFKYDQYVKPLKSSQLQRTKNKVEARFSNFQYYDNKDHIYFDKFLPNICCTLSAHLSFKVYSTNLDAEIKNFRQIDYPNLAYCYKAEIKQLSDYFYLIYEPTDTSYNDTVLNDYLMMMGKLMDIRNIDK